MEDLVAAFEVDPLSTVVLDNHTYTHIRQVAQTYPGLGGRHITL